MAARDDGQEVEYTDPSELATVLGSLQGEHTAGAGERRRVWIFAGAMMALTAGFTCAAAATRFLELSDNPAVWQLLGTFAALALVVTALAVTNARRTSHLKFVFAATSVVCFDGDGQTRWQVARGDIRSLVLRHIDERRLILFVVTHGGKRYVVRGFDSVRAALG